MNLYSNQKSLTFFDTINKTQKKKVSNESLVVKNMFYIMQSNWSQIFVKKSFKVKRSLKVILIIWTDYWNTVHWLHRWAVIWSNATLNWIWKKTELYFWQIFKTLSLTAAICIVPNCIFSIYGLLFLAEILQSFMVMIPSYFIPLSLLHPIV